MSTPDRVGNKIEDQISNLYGVIDELSTGHYENAYSGLDEILVELNDILMDIEEGTVDWEENSEDC